MVGCNFCPFASRELRQGGIHYEVLTEPLQESIFLQECQRLDDDSAVSTSFLILTQPDLGFDEYLGVVEQAQEWLEDANYEGVYQLASFHPDYRFATSHGGDPADFTNRSPYPMLHFLRESAVSAAIDSFPGAESIPDNNIRTARQHGLEHMQGLLRDASAPGGA